MLRFRLRCEKSISSARQKEERKRGGKGKKKRTVNLIHQQFSFPSTSPVLITPSLSASLTYALNPPSSYTLGLTRFNSAPILVQWGEEWS